MSAGKDTIDMKSNKTLRAEAREALLGNLRLTVGAILVYSLVVYALQFLTNISGLNSLAAFLLIGLTLLYLTAILQGLLEIGLSSIFLDLSFGQPSGIRSLFRCFRENTNPAVILKAIMAFLYVLCSLPAIAVEVRYFNTDFPSYKAMIPYYAAGAVTFLIGQAARILIDIIYAPVNYLFLDFPGTEPFKVLQSARKLMRGHKGRYFLLKLSFLPLHALGLLTLGIANFWVIAYEMAAETEFYRELIRIRTTGKSRPGRPVEEA